MRSHIKDFRTFFEPFPFKVENQRERLLPLRLVFCPLKFISLYNGGRIMHVVAFGGGK